MGKRGLSDPPNLTEQEETVRLRYKHTIGAGNETSYPNRPYADSRLPRRRHPGGLTRGGGRLRLGERCGRGRLTSLKKQDFERVIF